MDMDIQNNSFLSIDQLANQYLNSSRKDRKKQHRKIWYLSRRSYRTKARNRMFPERRI